MLSIKSMKRSFSPVVNCSGSNPLGQMSSKTVLYTSNALCIGIGDGKGIYGYRAFATYPSSMDFTLGYDERNNNPDPSYYWAAVRERFLRGVIILLPKNHTVVVYGDKNAVDDPTFRQVIEGAINELSWDDPTVHYPDDPEFLVARGAALIVRRGGYYAA